MIEVQPRAPEPSNVLPLLSSIRGGAAIIVASVHAFQVFVLPYFGLYGIAHLATSWLATYAVMAFFLVSGFMIFMSVKSHRLPNGMFDFKSFLYARVLRIFPPLFAATLISMGVYFIIQGLNLNGASSFRLGGELFLIRESVLFEWDRLLSTLLLTYNVVPFTTPPLSINGSLWTLAFEWWFYIFIAAFFSLASQWSLVRAFFVISLLILFCFQPSGVLFWVLFIVWSSGFGLGYLHAQSSLSSPHFKSASRLIVSICLIGIVTVCGEEFLMYIAEPLQRLGNRAHVTMMFVSLIMAVLLAYAIRAGIKSSLFAAASRYSYTLYLVHFPLLLFGFSIFHPLVHEFGWLMSGAAGLFSLVAIVLISARLSSVIEDRILIANWVIRIMALIKC